MVWLNYLTEHGERLSMKLNPKNNNEVVDSFATKYVVVLGDGRDILSDPTGGEDALWWSYNKSEAELQVKIVRKDFQQSAYVLPVEQAVRVVAKRRYDIELRAPHTFDSYVAQLTKQLLRKDMSRENTNIRRTN
jgi:hypothetical protein